MQKDAEEHAEEDAKKKEMIEARNMAEQLIYSTEKTLKDAGDKGPTDTQDTIKSKIDALNAVKEKDNLDDIKKATEELSGEAQKIYQFMQDASSEASAKDGAQDEAKSEDGGRDAELEEEKKAA